MTCVYALQQPPCLPVLLVRLLFDQPRSELQIDALLDRRALVIGHVHRARQLDEIPIEALFGFLVPDAILDVPQALVDVLQRALIECDVLRGAAPVPPGLLQQRKFQLHVGELGGIEDAHLLDPENGDLVEQLARRDGNENVFHGRDPSNSSSFAVTCSTLMRSMTPGSSILWFHGNSPGSQPRKARAAWGYASTHHRPDRYGPRRADHPGRFVLAVWLNNPAPTGLLDFCSGAPLELARSAGENPAHPQASG